VAACRRGSRRSPWISYFAPARRLPGDRYPGVRGDRAPALLQLRPVDWRHQRRGPDRPAQAACLGPGTVVRRWSIHIREGFQLQRDPVAYYVLIVILIAVAVILVNN